LKQLEENPHQSNPSSSEKTLIPGNREQKVVEE
jgi:hypothetical protein